jgi:predicted DNA-binding transcriptional regulator YafY
MTRSERLLAIMQSMRRRRTAITASALGEEFNVSERTIYRDIATLVSQGALIEGSAGFGYAIRPGHFLPPLMFSLDEADAIKLGLRFVMRRGDPKLAMAALDAEAKIKEVISQECSDDETASGLVVAPLSNPQSSLVGTIRRSIREERKLAIAYRNAEEETSSRLIWPVALGFFDECEMLGAWCELRGDFRHFRVDRILECHQQADRLPIPHRRLIAEYRKLEPGLQR